MAECNLSVDHDTIFDNSPNPKPRGPWMQQTFNPYQQIGNPDMGRTKEVTLPEGNPAAAFQTSPTLE